MLSSILLGLSVALGVQRAAALPANELVIGNGAAAALNWGAGALSQVGNGGDAHSMTRWSWADCGTPTDAIGITSLRVSPDPPQPGQNLTIYAAGTARELIDAGAYADIVVKLGLIKLLTKRFDVCDELSNANSSLQCPVVPDDYEVVQTVALPREIPRAKFQVQVHAFTQTAAPMACLTIDINFLLPNPK